MIDYINNLDTKLFLFLNELHHPILDPIMLFFSKSYIPTILIILLFFIYGLKKYGKNILLAFFFFAVTVGLSDSISSRIFKPSFERLRPCKQVALTKKIYMANEKCWGGKYGFVSSHAANSFGAALFIFLLFGKFNRIFGLFFVYAAIVSYSRIYLAKHFPLDLFFGALIGMGCAYFSYKALKITAKKLKISHSESF